MVQFPVESVEEFGNVRRNNVFKRATSIQLVLLVCLLERSPFLSSHLLTILVKKMDFNTNVDLCIRSHN